jgi:hypothetical protein
MELLPLIRNFVTVARAELPPSPDRPLRLALPLIGTGRGGLAGAKGNVIEPLIDELKKHARQDQVDFVLCTIRDVDWSAIQSVRKKEDWPLTDEEHQWAEALADKARAQSLVLFLGAGVSLDAGLPAWKDLLEELCKDTIPRADRKILSKLDNRDYAELIERKIGGRPALLQRLEGIMGGGRHVGLTHALLASLGAQEAVTTNYDELFELACTVPPKPRTECITILPYERVSEGRPWLLKLHGTIGHAGSAGDRGDGKSVVITRSDYMRLSRERSALFGIVQAMLVTKHLLFVGYSLSDEDFYQLIDEIRLAISPEAVDPQSGLGTVLTVSKWPLAESWKGLLNVRELSGPGKKPDGRRQQIFLDRVAYFATPSDAYLLNREFDKLLQPDEREIAKKLAAVQKLVDNILSAKPDSKTARAVRKALDRFGAPACSND